LGLPRPEDVREGVIAARIAAHAGDVARGRADAWAWDRRLSEARRRRDWPRQLAEALDPERAQQLRDARRPEHGDVCSMCGDYCVFKVRDEESDEAEGEP
ncbi:MAG: phosphomethylpyrimidine synthase ThiC, partial [Acidobacteria bacterium]|nr:phosphomethylpyrimidine synthase ThiC [Acidobacteriota bacterium]